MPGKNIEVFRSIQTEEDRLDLPRKWMPLGHPAEGAAINAQNDAEAAATWLEAKGARSAHTFDSYRREAARLLLWLGEQRLALVDLKAEHVHLYFAHLAKPPAHWIRKRKPRCGEKLLPTQVMAGALSVKSIGYARTVLCQMCAYLQDAGYIQRNVFKLSAKLPVVVETAPTKILDIECWNWLWQWLCGLPSDRPADAAYAARARWLFALLYHTGLRREEVAHGRMGDFIRWDQAWSLNVIGKGSKIKRVTVNSSLLDELVRYRRSLGFTDCYPVPGEDFPLVASLYGARQRSPLTPRAIGKIVNKIAECAEKDCYDEHHRALISRLSTHWMRHTNATHRLLAGASLETTQDELGHSDPKTTRIYAKVSDKKRKEDAELLARLGKFETGR
jgi:site-specific recombinase XerD